MVSVWVSVSRAIVIPGAPLCCGFATSPRLDIPSTSKSALADAFRVPEDAVNLSDLVPAPKMLIQSGNLWEICGKSVGNPWKDRGFNMI